MSTLQVKWGEYFHIIWKNVSQKTMIQITAIVCMSAILAWIIFLIFRSNY